MAFTYTRTYTYRNQFHPSSLSSSGMGERARTSCFVSAAIKSNNSPSAPKRGVLYIYLTHHQRHHYDDDVVSRTYIGAHREDM